MPNITFTCDQAIFTSIRTPMGEGYRIIAASAGLRSEEKQAITRNSPSHDSLCSHAPEAHAFAFYALPTGRLCAAVSCYAGNEHTGRGGQRIYTHNLVLGHDQFVQSEFNPFNVLRGMIQNGSLKPQLTPQPTMSESQLVVESLEDPPVNGGLSSLPSPCRCHILQRLLDDGSLVLRLDGDWHSTAETIVLGLPGPLREKISFSAGLRYSAGRAHRLQVISDEKGTARTKTTGQKIEYVEPGAVIPSCADRSAWVTFVDRLWSANDIRTMVARTSKPYTDVSPPACERIGRLYNLIDEVDAIETGRLLTRMGDLLDHEVGGIEAEIRSELFDRVQGELCNRMAGLTWAQIKPSWSGLVALWKRSKNGTGFVQPIVDAALRSGMHSEPFAAADAALEVAVNTPASANATAHSKILDQILEQLCTLASMATPEDMARLARLCGKWQSVRPAHPKLIQLRERCRANMSTAGRT